MTFNMECVSAKWDEKSSKWEIVFHNVQSSSYEKTIWADVFVWSIASYTWKLNVPMFLTSSSRSNERVKSSGRSVSASDKLKRNTATAATNVTSARRWDAAF